MLRRLPKMAQASSAASRPSTAESAPAAMPVVRLEVRLDGGKPTLYEVGDGGFLIGGVAGCDLRLSGPSLPPVVCLIARHAGGASLRRLTPGQPILVNGRSVASTYLNNSDHVTIAGAELALSIASAAGPLAAPVQSAEVSERLRVVEAGERKLKEQLDQFVAEKAAWELSRNQVAADLARESARMETLKKEWAHKEGELAVAREDIETREGDIKAGREALAQERRLFVEQRNKESQDLDEFRTQFMKDRAETDALKAQLDQDRETFVTRYQERRERLEAKQDAVHKVVRRIQVARRKHQADTASMAAANQELALCRAETEARAEQLQREKEIFDEQHRIIADRQSEMQKKLAAQYANLERREQTLLEDKEALDLGQKQHQVDLVRLDRIQAQLDKRQRNLEQQALEVDHRFEQLQRDSRDLEDQAGKLDAWHERLTAEQAEFDKNKEEYAGLVRHMDQRAAALESQQAMLTTLKTRMERMREEMREQEQALSDQRTLQEASEDDLKKRSQDTAQARAALDNDLALLHAERKRFDERRTILETAVAQLRAARESLATEEEALRKRREEQDTLAVDQTEQAAKLLTRAGQLEALHARLVADRASLEERGVEHARSEQSLAALQDQVRRRSDELNESLRVATECEQTLEEQARQAAEAQRQADEQLAAVRKELEARSTAIEEMRQDLVRREEALRGETIRVEEGNQAILSQRQALTAERSAWELERQTAAEAAGRARAAMESARAEAAALLRQVPELETRAGASLERLVRARDQLREHLTEVHAYARHSREDLETARTQVQGEVDRVRLRELAMQAAQDNHRLAIAAFRHQLIEWRGIAEELRQNLLRDGDRLDRREAAVSEQAQVLQSTSTRLAQQAEVIETQQRLVENQRGEVTRHLSEMRTWYRKKLRDLSGVDMAVTSAEDTPPVARERFAVANGANRDILSVTGELEPGDQKLGDLLRTLGLVEPDILTVLFLEARRQRKSLRQLLLAGNFLTLYQMALIEAGNLDALVVGPVRVIDRLPSSPHEVAYRVFDPRHNRECVLRHLAEAEMSDAVRPDEFRQRFAAAAAVVDDHLATTFEVLEVGGRPAVLQEWLTGLPSSDWIALAAAPGVWCRLLSQAAAGLQAAHASNLVHGHLRAESFVITAAGTLKIVGLGEPSWLVGATMEGEAMAADDLADLGAIAAEWAAPNAARKGGKSKPLPKELQSILDGLNRDKSRYATAADLLADLTHKDDLPANAAAWDRFLEHVRAEAVDTAIRRSA